ncbi:hypothetical protein HY640_02090 [Candidatus Woesearchaeota archaeon]|nr:hypothetical protein [Candidatus Woesearchaeota archaeon]
MLKKRPGQISLEYAMVLSFVLLLILPAGYFLYTYTSNVQKQTQANSLNAIGRDVSNNGEAVFYLGYPSLITFEENMPEGVEYMEIYRDWNQKVSDLNFWFKSSTGPTELSFPSRVRMMGFFDKADFSQGVKNVRTFVSRNNTGQPYVFVTFSGECQISADYNSCVPVPPCNNPGVTIEDYTNCGSCIVGGGIDCYKCDYNGNCVTDNYDLLIWKMMVYGNSPPTASITGPATARIGVPVTLTATANDVDGNLDQVTISDFWAQLALCPASPCQVSTTFTEAGLYTVYVTASDLTTNPFPATVLSCTGDPRPGALTTGVADCGYHDYIEISVTP